MVTLLYWILLFPIFGYTTVVDVHLHLVNALIILADLWLSRLPYWLQHFPYPLAYLCLYTVFAGIYWAAGGKNPDGEDFIYPWLDFDRPHVTVPIIFLVVFVIFPLVHASLWALERRSRQLAKRRFERQDAEWAAAEEEVKQEEEISTHPGETGRRRRQRRQRLVSPPHVAGRYILVVRRKVWLWIHVPPASKLTSHKPLKTSCYQGTSSGRPHSQRYRWPWARGPIRPLTPNELTGALHMYDVDLTLSRSI